MVPWFGGRGRARGVLATLLGLGCAGNPVSILPFKGQLSNIADFVEHRSMVSEMKRLLFAVEAGN